MTDQAAVIGTGDMWEDMWWIKCRVLGCIHGHRKGHTLLDAAVVEMKQWLCSGWLATNKHSNTEKKPYQVDSWEGQG